MCFLFTSLSINSHFNFSAPLAQKALDCGHHVSYAVLALAENVSLNPKHTPDSTKPSARRTEWP